MTITINGNETTAVSPAPTADQVADMLLDPTTPDTAIRPPHRAPRRHGCSPIPRRRARHRRRPPLGHRLIRRTLNPPPPKGAIVNDYRYLPVECRNGSCDHEPNRCLRFRSRRCESGQCTHARQNLLCAVNYPTESSEATR